MQNIEGYSDREKKDPEDKYKMELVNFVNENNYTSDEMEEAYFTVLGVGEDEVSERLAPLVQKIEVISNEGYPLNRIAGLIGAKDTFENMVPTYNAFVDTMNISNNEKAMLKSIVERDRVGEISVFIGDNHVVDLKVKSTKSNEAKAYYVLKVLKTIDSVVPNDKKYTLTFTEE